MSSAVLIAAAADTRPVLLEGKLVRLEPMSSNHLPELAEVAFEPAIWR
jgi:hypothetical protein